MKRWVLSHSHTHTQIRRWVLTHSHTEIGRWAHIHTHTEIGRWVLTHTHTLKWGGEFSLTHALKLGGDFSLTHSNEKVGSQSLTHPRSFTCVNGFTYSFPITNTTFITVKHNQSQVLCTQQACLHSSIYLYHSLLEKNNQRSWKYALLDFLYTLKVYHTSRLSLHHHT